MKKSIYSSAWAKLREFAHTHRVLLFYITLFVIASAVFLIQASKILNPDGIEYVGIARHYLAADFHAAINGIWSPLLSWIFTIPLLIDVRPFLFFRVLVVGLAILVIVTFDYLLRRELKVDTKSKVMYHGSLLFVTAFSFYASILSPVTPDLFSVFCILLFLIFALQYARKQSIAPAILMGVIGGIGYYGKNYFFYFALAGIFLYFALRFFQKKADKKKTIIHFATAFAACLLVVAPWIVLMSIKYGQFTVNPIGDYSLAQVGPSKPRPPVLSLGLLEPPHDRSITAREDPTVFKFSPWSPTESSEAMRYFITSVIPTNIRVAFKILWPILLALAVFLIAYIRSKKKLFDVLNDKIIIYSLLFGVIYVGGYCLQHLYGGFRYIWPAYALFGVALIQITMLHISTLKKRSSEKHWCEIVVFSVLVALGAVTIWQEIPQFVKSSEYGIKVHQRIDTLESIKLFTKGDRIGSNDPYAAAYFCYALELRCYGKPFDTDQLKKFNIDYFINFPGSKPMDVGGTEVYRMSSIHFIKLDK